MGTRAPAAVAALAQATTRWPKRRTSSDGICGDAAHAARKSDHNPGLAGYCHAWDLSHDLLHGVDCAVIAETLRAACKAGTERRVTVIIFNRRIASEERGWTWRAYQGSNPHDKHMHVSIRDTRAACEDTRAWPGITVAPARVLYVCDVQHRPRYFPTWGSPRRTDSMFKEGQRYPYAGGKKNGYLKLWVGTTSGKTVQAWGHAKNFREV